MKNKKLKITILTLIISILTCGFVFVGNSLNEVDAAAADTILQCSYLINNNVPYKSNRNVGTVEGTGKFVVGEENVVLTANANKNYQLVGWQVTYKEQSNATTYIDTTGLTDNKKDVELVAKDSTKVVATVEFNSFGEYYNGGSFTLTRVFENLEISPVFDFIYYQVNATELMEITEITNNFKIGENTLYYSNVATETVTKYSNAYLKIENEYYYYGDLYEETVGGTKSYYTLHQTQTSNPDQEKVDYLKGAFRVGEKVEISNNVLIDETDIKSSVNVDLAGVTINSSSDVGLTKYEDGVTDNYFNVSKDAYLRTKQYNINFEVSSSDNYINNIDLDVHKLYIVDLKLKVDGDEDHNELNDLFGKVEVFERYISSNISIYNFYSRITNNNLQFFVKSGENNGSTAFMVSCANTISKTIDGNNYKYYNFASLDGVANNTKSYPVVTQNFEVVIDYLAVTYDVDFKFALKETDSKGNSQLVMIDGNLPAVMKVKRGETLTLDNTTVASVENFGYKFIGYVVNLTDEISATISYTANLQKPKGATIIICYEKIEYTLVLTNFNQAKIGTTVAIDNVSFNTSRKSVVTSETIRPQTIEETSVTLNNKIKLGDSLNIDTKVNAGFNVLGYSLVYFDPNTVTAEDCFTSFDLTQEFIKTNNLSDTITIYVYEKIIKYTVTYFIEPTLDSNQSLDVLMATIDAECADATILKYDIDDVLISAENNNLTAMVAKIELSNLKMGDIFVLKSVPLTVGEGVDAYTYSFNWFTEDDKSTLSYIESGDSYNHEESVTRDKVIKVVYSMPSTKLLITIDEEYAIIEEFGFDVVVVQNATVVNPEFEGANSYIVQVGAPITISISNLSFGYKFVGYNIYQTGVTVDVNGTSFDYSANSGVNNLVFNFQRLEYRFVFTQFGGGKTGEYIEFGNNAFAVLNIDNTAVQFDKPIGYYVASVKFGPDAMDTYSSELSENNNYRFNANIVRYSFALTRAQFIDLVQNYSEINAQGVIEVQVRIDYLIFTYNIEVSYSLTNPKGDSRDDYVIFPTIMMSYVYETDTITANKINGTKMVTFTNVPYGADGVLRVLSGAPTGLSVTGWTYSNDSMVLQGEYEHSSNHLTLGEVTYDKVFKYKLTYNAYELNVVYQSGQGSPKIYINNNLVTGETKQVTLYDKIEIDANALRSNGYIFKNIKYNVPSYTEYEYNVDTWETLKYSLYLKNGDNYELNTLPNYDSNNIYYNYSIEEVVVTNSIFVDDSFHVLNYALDNKTINFFVEYELLQMNIVNNLKEQRVSSGATMLGVGNGSAKIEFILSDIASFVVTAKDSRTSIVRNISEYDTVTFYDFVTVYVSINKSARNFDGKVYDLTKGLSINSIKMFGEACGYSTLGDGVYVLTFSVGEKMPEIGETIVIDYTLKIGRKNANVTTIVQNSATFYENIQMFINARDYGFEGSIFSSIAPATSLDEDLQFLATATMYTSFTTSYKDNFIISGVTIYCNGLEITPAQYSDYGITFVDNIVKAQFAYNIDVVFKVQPKITYNGGPNFEKVFMCDNTGAGLEQQLTVGSTSDYDIQLSDLIADCVRIQYLLSSGYAYPTDSVVNCGDYIVLITFVNNNEYDWLSEIIISDSVNLRIIPKDIYVTYKSDAIKKVEKEYDGISDWDANLIYQYLIFTDNAGMEINYSNIVATGTSNLALKKASAYISLLGNGDRIKDANENVYYNLYVYDLALKENSFNNNFNLKNQDLLINNYVKINRREIRLSGLQVYDKVYDGTDNAELALTENIKIINTVNGDNISLNAENLGVKFENKNVGVDKVVLIDAKDALVGLDVKNYIIKNATVTGLTIYPYSLTDRIENVGEITIINRRGLTDKTKVDLIPVNATFRVVPIYADSKEYVDIYKHISQHFTGNNEFAIGYKLELLDGGKAVTIDNDLYLSIPNIKNLTGSFFLTGTMSGSVNYKMESNKIVIDLSQIDENISQIFLTQKRILLKPWQIILIVTLVVLVVATVILVVVILRKRKLERYSVNEKI